MFVREYIRYDVHGLASLIRSHQVSAEQVLDCAFSRLDEVNPTLNAIVTECSEFARKCLSEMHGNEPFYGVPLLVKDLGHAIKGVRTTEGSKFFAKNVAKGTSDLVRKLISMGFVPFAKTNTPELGLSYVTESRLLGPCHNPFDTTRTPGGSSGGSAASVASGIAPIATASDGGGSIRIPAACCGLFGFKPTTGLTPTGPWVDELWSGMATNFVITRSINDTSVMFDKLANNLKSNSYQNKKSLTITELEGVFAPVPIASEYMNAVNKVKNILIKAGHNLDKQYLALDLEEIGNCAMTLIAANTYAVIKVQELESAKEVVPDDVEPVTWEFYQQGKILSAYELIRAKNRLYQLLYPLHELLSQTDIVLTPALAQLPLLIGQLKTDDEFNSYLQKNTEFSPFTSLFNQAGLPAMTLPIMFHEHLPISVQLGAAKGNDLLLLSLAKVLQMSLPDFASVMPI